MMMHAPMPAAELRRRAVCWESRSPRVRWKALAAQHFALWGDEPDLVVWRTDVEHVGVLRRHPHLGSWCGYVLLPSAFLAVDPARFDMLNVHWGVTYLQRFEGTPRELSTAMMAPHSRRVFNDRHVQQACGKLGVSDVGVVLGFDTAHSGDLCPASANTRVGVDVYRTVYACAAEVEFLAAQCVLDQLVLSELSEVC